MRESNRVFLEWLRHVAEKDELLVRVRRRVGGEVLTHAGVCGPR